MATLNLKSILNESPDTLILKDKHGNERWISYGGDENAVTGIIFNTKFSNKNYFALVDDPELGQFPVINLNNPEREAAAIKVIKDEGIVEEFIDNQKGHNYVDGFLDRILFKIYNDRDTIVGEYSDDFIKFRIFYVDGKRYFTVWGCNFKSYKKNLPVYIQVVKGCRINPDEILWEVNTENKEVSYDDRYQLFTLKQLNNILTASDKPAEKVEKLESEIQKRIKEIYKKLSDMEADEHVKGATWSVADKKRHRLDMLNLKAELDALSAAEKSGETDIKKVVIKTIDSLSDEGEEIVPADILYAELEKKLSKYGTSAVAIIRSLKNRGVDIKKALREINEKFDGRASATELFTELSNYGKSKVNENEASALAPMSAIQRLVTSDTTPDQFLKTFKGHKLKDLLDKLSFCRLYIMNKYDNMLGNEPDQRFAVVLDTAISYINYRLIWPARKKMDDINAEDDKRPEIIAFRKKRSEMLRQSFLASRNGDHDLAAKIRSQLLKMEEPSNYKEGMKQMEAEVKMIHETPLSLADVTPSNTDTDRDKKNYEAFVRAFNNFKND